MINNSNFQDGYTLIELLVALAVSAIVISGTYAGYSFFNKQYQNLSIKTNVNRNVLKAMNLIQSDIRQAGFKDYTNANGIIAAQAIQIDKTSSEKNALILVFDDYNELSQRYRSIVRYYITSTSTRNRLMKGWRRCFDESNCTWGASSSITDSLGRSIDDEPILDWVTNFTVTGLTPKIAQTIFKDQFQIIQIDLEISPPTKIEGTGRSITRNYIFFARARNVSLVN